MAHTSDLNITVDVVVPTVFVIAICIINGFVLRFILRKRREYQELEAAAAPSIEEPTTSAKATALVTNAPIVEANDSTSIEMERL
ncbi:uncharacterized protein LOC127565584 [Drosophila albomicans]|uniref:Uncharacterized protein LOC127565584 n=1 Tax=Drosophila albomicans TaxID=7291 RepID=A0A9C6SWW8_DROAB|nr:uncharacterized protein LOC127565584 [Drosophila albomicans]